jgi:chemotaxis protein methyltransferase CheR
VQTAAQYVEQALVDQLVGLAAKTTGFQREAVRPRVVQQVVQTLTRSGWSAQEIVTRATAEDRLLCDMLHRVVAVGETYFFRQREHFSFIAEAMHAGTLPSDHGVIRAWSAGCATGEETYSLASTLLNGRDAQKGPVPAIIGTDLLESNLEVARIAKYGPRSIRSAGMLFPLLGENGEVVERVRSVVSFREHNLLEPLTNAPAAFHLVMCRNVFVYFAEDALWKALSHLVEAVVPDGLLIFGTMDLPARPQSLAPVGPPELAIYRRIARAPTIPPPSYEPPPIRVAVPPAGEPSEPLVLHLRALSHIESGDPAGAAAILAELNAAAPDYIPGLMERALLHLRSGERQVARTWLRRVLEHTDRFDGREVLVGPEPAPVRFYRDSVRALLARGT